MNISYSTKEIANEIVREGRNVSYKYVTRDELHKVIFNAPNISRLPMSSIYRVVIIDGVNGIPCTGTHVRNTKEVGNIKITRMEELNDAFRLYYTVR